MHGFHLSIQFHCETMFATLYKGIPAPDDKAIKASHLFIRH